MVDWIKRLFEDQRTLNVITVSTLIGLIVSLAQGVVQRRHGGWGGLASSLATGIPVAVIVGLAIRGIVQEEGARFAVVAVCAIISGDIWAGLQALGRSLRADPWAFIFRVLDAVRGQSPRAEAVTPAQHVKPAAPTATAGMTRPSPLEGGKK